MSGIGTLDHIFTREHIRTMCSVRGNTGPARWRWPRCKETERLAWERGMLKTRREATKLRNS